MKPMQVVLNGKTIEAPEGITILDLANREGIAIPTLCHDKELVPYGSCWVCAVKVEGRRGFVTSCGTRLTPGMNITTEDPEIHAARKMALELLISDHYADCEAPCKLACPDQVDVQTYVSLIANGKYHEAVKVIKDTLPMPLSIGRVCPAFCEVECRRKIVEEPIAIRQLKRFAADEDLEDFWQYIPEIKPDNGKKVAIIGGGPSGLTCGYYLSFEGFEVHLFEAEEACGGWLRYGIPEYRLPKDILDCEIELMTMGGMQIHYGMALGKELSLSELSKDYDAVYLAVGAQNAVPMPVPGSDLAGCYLGVDFLKSHAKGQTMPLGKKIAIVGGGNTAIDCARTSIRLGCDVSVIYRRTKAEMPAEAFEIEAAIQEGVIFHFLCNPVQYTGVEGQLKEVRIEKMRLGEPDKSGRKRPEPTGEYFTEEFDSIIAAISQVPEVSTFSKAENKVDGKMLPISRWQTAIVDTANMYTGIANIFAGGDFQRGAATAIEAIADGRKAFEAIQSYLLTGELPKPKFVFDSKKAKKLEDVSPQEYEIFEKAARIQMPEIPLDQAIRSFKEVETGFSEDQARSEANRCLECGCQVNDTCALRSYCSEYEVEMDRFMGSISRHPIDYTHPYIVRDANKCINCGRCIRTCAEIQGANVLGFIYRGFSAIVAPEFGESLTQTSCLACGKCTDVCPVGALVERNLNYKLNPRPKEDILQNCGLCGVGCKIQAEIQAGEVVRITTPEQDSGFNGKNLCFKGRFGWQSSFGKLHLPLIKRNGEYQVLSWKQAFAEIKAALGRARTHSVEITPHITCEEMLIAGRIAETLGLELSANPHYFAFSDGWLDTVPKAYAFGPLDDHKEYVVVGDLNCTLRAMLRLQQRQGKKLSLVAYPANQPLAKFADLKLSQLEDLPKNENQLYIYNQNRISESEAAQIWLLAGNRQGVLVTTDYTNHGAFLNMVAKPVQADKVDFALCFGQVPASQAEFKVAVTPYLPEGNQADIILPAPNYLEIEGCAIGDNGEISRFANPSRSVTINELMRVFYQLNWISPATADLPHWNNLAAILLSKMSERAARPYDTLPEIALREAVVPSDAPVEKYLESLYELRKIPVKFSK
ncbi:MAG: FAD-dependent oxidoreductase [Candidatus Cloacimonetes bacterium]|nr:FAD-dependent oxidoreductase [Candidatus Cloacimonadota bacterium]